MAVGSHAKEGREMTSLCKTIKAGVLLSVLSIFFPCLSLHAAEDKLAWQVEWEKSVQAAKKEGQLVNYGGEEITHPEILKAFNKDYPEIKVTTAGGHGSELGARILAERRAGKFLVDLYAGGPTTPYRVLYLSKALDPITPLFLFPEITDQSKWFTGKHIYADPDNRYLFLFEGSVSGGATIYVNTRYVNTAEFKSYWDLLQPKWKGKILFMDPKSSSLGLNAATALFNDPDLGPEFLKRLFTEMDVAISGNRRQGTDWLSSGKYYICFACRDTEMAIKQGLPVGEVDPLSLKEGANEIGGGSSSVLAFLNKAPHPNAAKVFINWFLSRQGQILWQRVMNKVVVEGSDSMRIDIPKDDVLPDSKRMPGRNYRLIGFRDPKPVLKFLDETVK
jgi:iron(III) transport system substrate-binding protein